MVLSDYSMVLKCYTTKNHEKDSQTVTSEALTVSGCGTAGEQKHAGVFTKQFEEDPDECCQ